VALPPNGGATGVFTVALAQGVRPNQIYTNRMDITESTTLYGLPPGGIAERNDTANSITNFRVPGLGLAKILDSTSETNNPPDSTNSFVQIGEVATYRLAITLPESTITNLTVVDTISSNGLAYVFGSARLVTTGFVGSTGAFTESPTGVVNTLSAMGQQMTFSFTNVVVTGDNDTNNNTFYLLADYLVLDHVANDGLPPGVTVHTNRATLTYIGNPGAVVTSAVVTTTVIEPDVQIAKTVAPTLVDAGDTVTVTLVLTNAGTATAYELLIEDVLPPLYFDISSLTNVVAPTGFVSEVAGNTFRVLSDTNAPTGTNTLEAGEAITITFDIDMAQSLPPNSTITNVATVDYDSLAGTNIWAEEREYDAEDDDVLWSRDFSIVKVLEATSEVNDPPDSTNSFVQIGETVTYRISITPPEGTITNLTVTDTISVNGLAYVFGSANLDTADFVGNTGDFVEDPSGPGLLSAMGQQMTFTFTNVVVTADNNPANDTFDLLLTYLVLNDAANDGLPPDPTVHTNVASVTYAGNPSNAVVSGTVTTTVIEPQLNLTKDILQTFADAGDMLDVTLVISNSGTATAYDLALSDLLDPLYFVAASVTNVNLPTGYVHEVVGDTFWVRSDTNAPTGTNTLEAGESLEFTLQVEVAQTVAPSQIITNTAVLRADSLANTNIFDVQREYFTTNSDTFSVSNFCPTCAKTLYATSETGPADSTNDLVQVGEIVTFQIANRLPETTIPNLVITDYLPEGLAYVVGSLVVDTNDFYGSIPVPTVTPNAPPLGGDGENIVILFPGNTEVFGDNEITNNIIRVRLDAVVLDTNFISGLPPQSVLTNYAGITYIGNPGPEILSSNLTVTVIEPDVDIFKTVAPDSGDAGDAITVTLTATNSGLATAYDLLIEDELDGTVFDTATLANVSMPDGFTFMQTPGPTGVTVQYASDPAFGQPTNTLEIGEPLEFVFTVNLAQAVEPGGLYTNTVSLETDTIYETNAIGIQRSYTNEAQDSLTVSNMFIAKALIGTSATGPADSTNSYVQIGEIASYRLTVTLPESTITNLTVVDVVPAGMSYVAGSVFVDVGGFGGSLPGVPVVTGGGGSGDDVIFTFEGLTVVSNNNDGTDNSFAIEFDLLTLDVGGNTGTVSGSQTVLPNSATITYDGNPPVHTSGVVNVTVIEPVLGITKTMGEASNSVVVIDLVVTNSGLATAFDVEIEDILTTVWWDTDTIVPVTVPAGFTFALAGNPGDATITITSEPASAQPTNSIEAGESLLFQFQARLRDGAPSPVTNLATITEYSSLDGDDPEERDYGPVEDEDVLAIPGYTLVKTRTSPLGRAAAVGETVTFDLVVANTGGVGLDPVPLEDRYDVAYLSYQGAVPASEDNVDDGTINWTNVGPLAVGGSVTVAVEFVAIESTFPGETTNFVVASPFTTNGLPLLPKTNEAPVEVVYAGYTLEKVNTTPGPGTSAQVGDPVVFTITIVNTGQVALVTVPVADTYETAYLSYMSSVPASDDNDNDGVLNWANIGPLAAGATTQIVATFTANASTLSLPRTNVVTTAPTTAPEHPDVPPSTNDAPYRISQAGYLLAKVRTAPVGRAAQVGETVTFLITVTNTGDVELATVSVEDTYETAYLTYGSAVPASDDNDNDGVINWADIGPLPAGASTQIVATFTAFASTLGADRTNVVVTAPTTPPDEPPVPPQTNDAPYEVASASYALTKVRTSPAGRAAQVGEAIVFTITVENDGDVDLVTVPVEDTYETAYLSYVSSVPASDDNDNDGVLNWADIGPLPVGATTQIVATFTAAASSLGADRTNVVTTAPTTPPDKPDVPPQTNDSPYAIHLAGYTLEKTLIWPPGRPAIIGETVLFMVSVVNTGDVELVTVPVQDVYETNYLSYVAAAPDSDDNDDDGVIDWADIGPIPVGDSADILMAFTAVGDTLGADRTNVVSTAPTTPPDAPPVPPSTNDAPYQVDTPASLGDRVWLDVNGDGLQGDPGDEPGIENVLVTLYDADTNALDTTTTDASGFYSFTNLVPGTYFVGFTPPPGYEITLQNQGGDVTLDSDADRTTGYTVPTTLISGENDLTWDAGLYEPASLGNFVWDDLNADGIQDAGEPGIEGVTVNLLTNGTIIASTTTDVSGAYAFTNLPPWDYTVQVVVPAGYDVSPQDAGADDAVDSDIDTTTGLTTVITLVSGQDDPTWDAGLYLPASLGDYVWEDVNGNGIQDGGEPPVPNVLVTLYDADTNALDTTTTDASGFYSFTNLVPGTYFVGFTPPAGWQITLQDRGGDDALDSDADPVTGFTIPTVLISGENDLTWDAGLYRPASLGNFVWDDLNADGIQDAGEPGIEGVTVNLLTNGTIIASTTTDVSGAYAFTNLPPWDYTVQVVVPAGYDVSPQDAGADDAVDSDIDTTTGLTTVITLVSGQDDPTWDAGLYLPASLGDYVWEDVNGNGIQDGGRAAGAECAGDAVRCGHERAGHDDDGRGAGFYSFTNLVPGTYFVGFTPPAGWQITLQDRGGDDALDSDADPVTGFTIPTVLISGENDLTWDAGLYRPASLGDFVWDDLNADGIQDAGEPGIENVTVNLLTNGTIIASTTTDVNGAVCVHQPAAVGLPVQVVPPVGYAVSPQDAGADAHRGQRH
jgi:uncharacterized repeat protein (TIGR01451 family)/fimbrial isopeptide formation D2 family protein